MIYQYPTQFDVDILTSSMLHVGSFDAEILSLERLLVAAGLAQFWVGPSDREAFRSS